MSLLGLPAGPARVAFPHWLTLGRLASVHTDKPYGGTLRRHTAQSYVTNTIVLQVLVGVGVLHKTGLPLYTCVYNRVNNFTRVRNANILGMYFVCIFRRSFSFMDIII